ncbi:amino acid ABC transporter permease, partial [Streptococcus suis]
EQVFALYIMVALIYFSINFASSSLSRYVAKSWASSIE